MSVYLQVLRGSLLKPKHGPCKKCKISAGDDIEKHPTIKFTENISDNFWIHETQSAINHEFKIRSIQAPSVQPNSPGSLAA